MGHARSPNSLIEYLSTGVAAVTVLLLSGCTGISVATPAAIAQATNGSLSIVAQSTPSTLATVQSLRLQITSAVLNPGNVQLMTTPVTLDLANITTGSAFLATASVPAGTYSSLAVSFSTPSLSVSNTSGTPLAIPGGSCAAQSTCTFVPALTTGQANISTGVLPLTVTSGKTTSFALTLAVGKILQSDDSLDFSSGVNTGPNQVGTSSTNLNNGNTPLDAAIGVVQSIANGQLVLLNETNDVLPVITVDSGTVFNYPLTICPANNNSCIAAGEIIVANLSLTPAGAVHAESISYADMSNTKLLQGTVSSISQPTNSFQLLVDKSFGFTSSPSPDESTVIVTLQPGSVFGINSTGYPAVSSGTSFSSLNDMVVGQTVLIDVVMSSQLPNVSSSQVLLTDYTASGTISALSSNQTFTLTNYAAEQDNSSPITSLTTIQAGAGTFYRNLTPASFPSLTNGQSVSVTGPLFNTSPTPTLASDQISLPSSSDQ